MKRQLIAILILAIFMAVLPLHLRFAHGNQTLAGIEPYYHARMAMQISEGNFEDNAIVNRRTYELNPYHILLALAYKLIGPLAFNLVPILLAIASFVLLWMLLVKLNISKNTQPWILLAYALSPPIIAAASIGTPHAFVLTLLMAGTYLLLTRAWILGTIAYLIASMSGLIYNITAIVFLLVLLLAFQKNTKQFAITAIISVITIVIGKYPPQIEMQRGIMQYISDFGGMYGFSIFALLLAIVGAVLVWKCKAKYYGAYFLVISFMTASFFFPNLLVFSNVMISALAGTALAKLAQRKWELKFLRQAALLVLFCGLLFSSISHAVAISDIPPINAFFKALEFHPGTVLTHENYGFWVEMAGHKAVMDPLWKELPEAEDQAWDVAALFKSTDLEKTRLLAAKYGITHIAITPEMEHGLLWEREEEGLDFLAKNSETFKRLETGTNIGVWRLK